MKTTILCSLVEEGVTLVCDLPLGHKGPHKATILWGDEPEGDDDDA